MKEDVEKVVEDPGSSVTTGKYKYLVNFKNVKEDGTPRNDKWSIKSKISELNSNFEYNEIENVDKLLLTKDELETPPEKSLALPTNININEYGTIIEYNGKSLINFTDCNKLNEFKELIQTNMENDMKQKENEYKDLLLKNEGKLYKIIK